TRASCSNSKPPPRAERHARGPRGRGPAPPDAPVVRPDMSNPLGARLGYSFRDPALLRQALTHRSYGTPHNERLEFVGDAVLNCVVARALYDRFPDTQE